MPFNVSKCSSFASAEAQATSSERNMRHAPGPCNHFRLLLVQAVAPSRSCSGRCCRSSSMESLSHSGPTQHFQLSIIELISSSVCWLWLLTSLLDHMSPTESVNVLISPASCWQVAPQGSRLASRSLGDLSVCILYLTWQFRCAISVMRYQSMYLIWKLK